MAVTIRCACGNQVQVASDADRATMRCPRCGLFLPILAQEPEFVRPVPPDDGSIHLEPLAAPPLPQRSASGAGRSAAPPAARLDVSDFAGTTSPGGPFMEC